MSTYQSWVEQVSGGREPKSLSEGALVQSSRGEPFGAIEFARADRLRYIAEIGKKGDDYIYHFFSLGGSFPDNFEDKLGDAFLEVFKLPERIEADYVLELNSWAVRAKGFAANPVADDRALEVFNVLDSKLE